MLPRRATAPRLLERQVSPCSASCRVVTRRMLPCAPLIVSRSSYLPDPIPTITRAAIPSPLNAAFARLTTPPPIVHTINCHYAITTFGFYAASCRPCRPSHALIVTLIGAIRCSFAGRRWRLHIRRHYYHACLRLPPPIIGNNINFIGAYAAFLFTASGMSVHTMSVISILTVTPSRAIGLFSRRSSRRSAEELVFTLLATIVTVAFITAHVAFQLRLFIATAPATPRHARRHAEFGSSRPSFTTDAQLRLDYAVVCRHACRRLAPIGLPCRLLITLIPAAFLLLPLHAFSLRLPRETLIFLSCHVFQSSYHHVYARHITIACRRYDWLSLLAHISRWLRCREPPPAICYARDISPLPCHAVATFGSFFTLTPFFAYCHYSLPMLRLLFAHTVLSVYSCRHTYDARRCHMPCHHHGIIRC